MKTLTPNPFEPLGNFRPISVLWEADPPIYQSEQSARWAFRALKPRLAEAGAIAYHCGRVLVDPQLVAEIARQVAIERARERYGV